MDSYTKCVTEWLFEHKPRDYAIEIAETFSGWETVARAFIASLSYDDIRECLDANELSPRFINDDDDDCVDEEGEDNYYGEDCEESSHD